MVNSNEQNDEIDYNSDYDITDNEEIADLDTSWINEFEKVDKDYESFYMEKLNYVKITFIYVNKLDEIDRVKEDKIFINNTNIISKEEIIEILKKNSIIENKKFKIITILKYNLDLEPLEVRKFLLNNDNNTNTDNSYLSVIKSITEIKWEKSISMFQDLNNLIIIFYENNKNKNNENIINNCKKSKKNYMALSSHSKTIKNKLKII